MIIALSLCPLQRGVQLPWAGLLQRTQ
jgi:hypothetical protein